MTHTVQLAVEYADHQTRYYPANRGWRIDAAHRCIVIGTDLPRIYVPLDGVMAFTVEQVAPAAPTCSTCGRKPPEGLLDTPWGPVCKARCQIRRTGPHPPEEMVWLGDLSGYFLSAERGEVVLNHRCGWEVRCVGTIPFLANLIVGPVEAHRDAGCNPHEG